MTFASCPVTDCDSFTALCYKTHLLIHFSATENMEGHSNVSTEFIGQVPLSYCFKSIITFKIMLKCTISWRITIHTKKELKNVHQNSKFKNMFIKWSNIDTIIRKTYLHHFYHKKNSKTSELKILKHFNSSILKFHFWDSTNVISCKFILTIVLFWYAWNC